MNEERTTLEKLVPPAPLPDARRPATPSFAMRWATARQNQR